MCLGLAAQPEGCGLEPLRQQLDVEDLASVFGLVVTQQVDQQGRKPGALERLGDELVAGAKPPATAAVSEEDNSRGASRQP